MKAQTLILAIHASVTSAFLAQPPRAPVAHRNNVLVCRPAAIEAVDLETIADIGYSISVVKPLGVVFGENRDPYNGLSVDDVEGGLNGGKAGMRVGDQLLAINGESMIGADFDSTMVALQNSPSPLDLSMYRGPISSLYTIVMNRRGEAGVEPPDEVEVDEIVMDENYESPVVVSLDDYEDDTISVSEVAKEAAQSVSSLFNFGKMFAGKDETIQMEDEDGK